MRVTDSTTNAFVIRQERALQGVDVEAEASKLVAKAAATIGHKPSVARMKELGGFMQVLRNALGASPDSQIDEVGIPTAEAYWLWLALNQRIAELRHDLKRRVYGEGVQACEFKRDGNPCPEAATNYMINESDQGGRVKKLACPHHFRTGRSAITRETGRLV